MYNTNIDTVNTLYLNISESILRLAIELHHQNDEIRLRALGIDPQYVRKISRYTQYELTRLCQFTVPFVETSFNNRVLELAIESFEQELHKQNIYDELLIHGATLTFIEQYTTLDKQEFTQRRKKLGLKNIGAPKTPTIEQCFQIDELWEKLPDDLPIIEQYLFTSKKLNIPISSICVHHNAIGLNVDNNKNN